MKRIFKKIFHILGIEFTLKSELPFYHQEKYRAEINFWKEILKQYREWFNGNLTSLYREPAPNEIQKIHGFNSTYSAILTWQKIHQQTKYLEDLHLSENVFENLRILDIGSGPLPSALVFSSCELYCIDPLIPMYLQAGFPMHIYEPRVKFVFGFSEQMPLEDNFFDAIISVNALDHVDDFNVTAAEIKRVLKPGGMLRFHLHYHTKTITEPLELNDKIVTEAFRWCEGFKKIGESKKKRGSEVEDDSELYTLWSNF